MRHKRAKQYKKAMALYHHNFNFREPYQVLVDGTFLHMAEQARMSLSHMVSRTVVGQCKLVMTPCTLHELKSVGKAVVSTLNTAQTSLDKRMCHHAPYVSARECLESMIGTDNPHHYCVATQDAQLRADLRDIPGVPMLYLKNSVMILEPPSAATHAKIAQMQQSKMMPTMLEKTALKPRPSANQNSNNTSTTQAPKKKKRRGPKGPNPLSCKKKKTAKPSASIDTAATSADSGK